MAPTRTKRVACGTLSAATVTLTGEVAPEAVARVVPLPSRTSYVPIGVAPTNWKETVAAVKAPPVSDTIGGDAQSAVAPAPTFVPRLHSTVTGVGLAGVVLPGGGTGSAGERWDDEEDDEAEDGDPVAVVVTAPLE